MSVVNPSGIGAGFAVSDPSWSKYALVDREGRSIYPNYSGPGVLQRKRQIVIIDYANGAADHTLTGADLMAGTIFVQDANGGANLLVPNAALIKQALSTFAPPLTAEAPLTASVNGTTNYPGTIQNSIVFEVKNNSGQTITIAASADATVATGLGSMAVANGICARFEINCVNTAGTYTYTIDRLA